jgi:hypothetical protein
MVTVRYYIIMFLVAHYFTKIDINYLDVVLLVLCKVSEVIATPTLTFSFLALTVLFTLT